MSTTVPSRAPGADAGRAEPSGAGARGRAFDRTVAVLGLLALLGLLVHVRSQSVGLKGVEAWLLSRMQRGPLEQLWWVPLLVYGLSIVGLLAAEPGRLRRAPTLWVTGLLGLSYGAAHGAQLGALATGPHTSARAVYEALWMHASGLPDLLFHVFGLCAISFHVGLGVRAAFHALFGVRGRAVAMLATGLAAAILLVLLHLFSHFALGEGLLPL